MLTEEVNRRLTLTGPGTPAGAMMRCFWHPIALADELPSGGAPIPVKVLGEELVLFRDDRDRLGLIGLLCSHRCADLSYGRIEDGGLRCLYHGWLYDIHGRCLEQPAEPPGSRYKDKIRHPAYPVIERAGLLFAYMGSGESPLLPDYEFLRAAPAHRFLHRTHVECNYLQAIEGDIDPAHMSYLHRSWRRPPWAHRDVRTVPGSDQPAARYLRDDRMPLLETEHTDFGVRNYAIRDAEDGARYVRISNFIVPNKVATVGGEGRVGEGYTIHWRVPADDQSHMRFDFIFNRARPVAHELYAQEFASEVVDHRYRRTKQNRFLQDRALMQAGNFSGMGDHHGAQDAFATETQGPIHNRSREHLGTSDACIVAARRALLAAVAAAETGLDPPHVIRDPSKNDMSHMVVVSEVVPRGVDHRTLWQSSARKLAVVPASSRDDAPVEPGEAARPSARASRRA